MKTTIIYSNFSRITHLDSYPVFEMKTVRIITRDRSGFLKFTYQYETSTIKEIKVEMKEEE